MIKIKKKKKKKEEEKKEEEKQKEEEIKNEEVKESEDTKKEEEEKKQVKTNEEKKEEEKNKEEEKEEKTLSEEEKKDKEETNEQKIIYENLDYFFSFLKIPFQEDNHVLVGYFYKIFNHLIKSKGTLIIPYIFNQRNDLLDDFINHIDRKLIGECINQIMTFNEKTEEDFEEKQLIFCEKIIKELNNTKSDVKLEFICETLKNAFKKQYFFDSFMSKEELINLLFSVIDINKDDEKKLCSILSLMIKINENLLSNFDNLVTPKIINEEPMNLFYGNTENESIVINSNKEEFKQNLNIIFKGFQKYEFNFLQDLNVFNNDEFLTTYQKNQNKLGIKKLTQIEYLRSILDIMINSYAKGYLKEDIEKLIGVAKEKNIFSAINYIFLNYEFNNLFQTLYLQILIIVLNEYSPQNLIEYFFNDILTSTGKTFLESLLDNFLNKLNFQFNENKKVFSGFFPIYIQAINNICQTKNIFLKQIISMDLKVIYEVFAYHINNFFHQKLYYLEPSNLDIDIPIPSSNATLEELVEEDLKVYDVYKKGGNYRKANMEKLMRLNSKPKYKNEEKKGNENNNSVQDLNNNKNEENNENEEKIEENDEGEEDIEKNNEIENNSKESDENEYNYENNEYDDEMNEILNEENIEKKNLNNNESDVENDYKENNEKINVISQNENNEITYPSALSEENNNDFISQNYIINNNSKEKEMNDKENEEIVEFNENNNNGNNIEKDALIKNDIISKSIQTVNDNLIDKKQIVNNNENQIIQNIEESKNSTSQKIKDSENHSTHNLEEIKKSYTINMNENENSTCLNSNNNINFILQNLNFSIQNLNNNQSFSSSNFYDSKNLNIIKLNNINESLNSQSIDENNNPNQSNLDVVNNESLTINEDNIVSTTKTEDKNQENIINENNTENLINENTTK